METKQETIFSEPNKRLHVIYEECSDLIQIQIENNYEDAFIDIDRDSATKLKVLLDKFLYSDVMNERFPTVLIRRGMKTLIQQRKSESDLLNHISEKYKDWVIVDKNF